MKLINLVFLSYSTPASLSLNLIVRLSNSFTIFLYPSSFRVWSVLFLLCLSPSLSPSHSLSLSLTLWHIIVLSLSLSLSLVVRSNICQNEAIWNDKKFCFCGLVKKLFSFFPSGALTNETKRCRIWFCIFSCCRKWFNCDCVAAAARIMIALISRSRKQLEETR